MAISKQPLKTTDAILQRIFNQIDANFQELDNRRLPTLTKLSSSASTADMIEKINKIIEAINTSDLSR